MANQIPVEVRIAEKMLEFMDGLSPILQYVNRKYEKEFTADAATWNQLGFGQTINVMKPPRYASQAGPSITNVQDINIGTIPVTINKWRNVAIQLGGWEASFNARQFDAWAEENLKPIVSPLLNDIEKDLFGLFSQIYNFVGTPNTGFGASASTAVDLLGAAREKLSLVGNTPMTDCVAFVNPTAARTFATAVAAGFNPQGEISETIRSSKIFQNANFKVFTANNVAALTTGTAKTNTVIVSASYGTQVGSTLIMTADTTTQTFVAGDVINIGSTSGTPCYSVNPTSKQSTGKLMDFVIQSCSTGSATCTAVITPAIIPSGAFQNVNVGAVASSSITLPNKLTATTPLVSIQNMAWWKDALGLVTVPIKAPEMLKATQKNYNGLNICLTTGSDIKEFAQIWRADIVYGVVVYYPENACRLPN